MGVSVSASTAIILVAALISFGMVYSAQDLAQDTLLDAEQSMTDRQLEMLATSIEINQARSYYDSGLNFLYSNVTVTNTGDTVIDLTSLHLMVNGEFETYTAVILPDGTSSNLLMPGEVVVLTDIDSEFRVDEMNRIKVITGNGVSDLKAYGGS